MTEEADARDEEIICKKHGHTFIKKVTQDEFEEIVDGRMVPLCKTCEKTPKWRSQEERERLCYFCEEPLGLRVALNNFSDEKYFTHMPKSESCHFECYIIETIKILR